MSTSPIELRPLARTVLVTEDELTVGLADGRAITVPLVWFPRLLRATPASRSRWELLGDGEGIHWPDADEDLSVEGLLAGNRARGVA
jgi:hypothetical protein